MHPGLLPPSADRGSSRGQRHLRLIPGGARAGLTPVGIAAGRPIVRAGLRALLEQDRGVTVVGEAATTRDAIALARALGRGVVLVDLASGELDGVTATRSIVESCDAGVLVVAGSASDGRIAPAVWAGASGLVMEGVEPRELVWAVGAVAEGGTVLPTGSAGRLVAEYR